MYFKLIILKIKFKKKSVYKRKRGFIFNCYRKNKKKKFNFNKII